MALAVVLCLQLFAVPAAADEHSGGDANSSETAATGWWTADYLFDYGVVIGAGAAAAIGETLPAQSEAMIGPSYDRENPERIFGQPGYSRMRRSQSVPVSWLVNATFASAGFVGAVEGIRWLTGAGSGRVFHEAMVGYAESRALTAAATSLLKPLVGRLRPDFQPRAYIYHCTAEPSRYPDECGGSERGDDDEIEESRELLEDGRRSFISGHTSHAFNIATYLSLVLGSHLVWGDAATGGRRFLGLTAQTVALGLATGVGSSRVSDRRHHVSDVVVGALVGVLMANISYWRRFNHDGEPRDRFSDVDQTTSELSGEPPAVGITLAF